MARKRPPIEDGNTTTTIHAKKQKQDDESPTCYSYALSKEEKKLLRLNRWYRPKSLRINTRREDMARIRDMYTVALRYITQAYSSIRTTATGNDDIVKVLKDRVCLRVLIHFATFFRRMREFSLCMGAIRTYLSMKLKNNDATASELDGSSKDAKGKCPKCRLIHAQASLMPSAKPMPNELSTTGNAEDYGGGNQFSIKVYNILLILNEMLTQMGIHSECVEEYGQAKLTGMLQRGMSLLRAEIEQEETLLIELINSGSKSECVSACDRLRTNLVSFLLCHARTCADSVSFANKEIHTAFEKVIHTAFEKVIELIYDIPLSWHTYTCKLRRPSRDEKDQFIRYVQHRLDVFSARTFAELGIQ